MIRRSFIALFLAILAAVAAFGANEDVVVRAAGSSAVNGIYRVCGTSNSKPYYTKREQACSTTLYAIRSVTTEWELTDSAGDIYYDTIGAVDMALPYSAAVWVGQPTHPAVLGQNPVPTFTIGLSPSSRSSFMIAEAMIWFPPGAMTPARRLPWQRA